MELNGTEWNRLQLDGPCLERERARCARRQGPSNRQLWEQNQKAKAPKQRGDGTRRRGMGGRMIRIDTAYLLAQMYEVSVDELIEQ